MDAELDHQARQLIDTALREASCPSEVSERGMQRLMQSLSGPISTPPVPPVLDEVSGASTGAKTLGFAGRTVLILLFTGMGLGAAYWLKGAEQAALTPPLHQQPQAQPSALTPSPKAASPEELAAVDASPTRPLTRNQRKRTSKRRNRRHRPTPPPSDISPDPQQPAPPETEAEPPVGLDLKSKSRLDPAGETQPLEDPNWKAVPRVLQQPTNAQAPNARDQSTSGDRPPFDETDLRGPGSARAGRGHDLRAESRRLRRAQDAVDKLKFARALRLVRHHRQRFPQAQLYGEALAIEALSLCALGRVDEGRRRVAELSRSYPAAPQLSRVRRACRG